MEDFTTSTIATMKPIWKTGAASPFNECTVVTATGKRFPISEETEGETGERPADIMPECGFVVVRPISVDGEDKTAEAVINSERSDITLYEDNEDYYNAPDLVTEDMIKLNVNGFTVLSDTSPHNAQTDVLPTFHGVVVGTEEDKNDIMYISAMKAAPVGIRFLTDGILKILRAPYVYESFPDTMEDDDDDDDDNDDDNSDDKETKTLCVKIQDKLVFNEEQLKDSKYKNECSIVSDSLQKQLEDCGDEIWTIIDVKKFDTLACLRATLFKIEPSAGNSKVVGKLLATIKNPISEDRLKYNRLSAMYDAISTGIISRSRWGVSFVGGIPPVTLNTDTDAKFMDMPSLDFPVSTNLYLEAPFHKFITDKCWSAGFPAKYKGRYSEAIKFSEIKKIFIATNRRVNEINTKGMELKHANFITSNKTTVLKKSYQTQQNKYNAGHMMSTSSLADKLVEMDEFLVAANEELKAVLENVTKRDELKVRGDKLKKIAETENIEAKSVVAAIVSFLKKAQEADKLPSDSRIVLLEKTVASLEKTINAAKSSTEKRKRGRTQSQDTRLLGPIEVPDANTYIPPENTISGIELSTFNQNIFQRSVEPRTAKKNRKRARVKLAKIKQAQDAIKAYKSNQERVDEPGAELRETEIPDNIQAIANSVLTELELELAKGVKDPNIYSKLLSEMSTLYAESCKFASEEQPYDVSQLDWVMSRIEKWPENPLATSIEFAKKQKSISGQTTLDGSRFIENSTLIECPNDDGCDNLKFITEIARRRIKVKSRCLICEVDIIFRPVHALHNRLIHAVEIRHPSAEPFMEGDRFDKIEILYSKIEKFYDQVYKCPAVSRSKAEPKAWYELLKRIKGYMTAIKSFPIEDLPEVPSSYSTGKDENFVPESEHFESDACSVCDGLMVKGKCLDCKSNEEEKNNDNEEESDDEEEEDVKSFKKSSRKRNRSNPNTAQEHLVRTIEMVTDPVVIETLRTALKKLKADNNCEIVKKYAAFIAYDQIIKDGEMVFDRNTAIRFTNKAFESLKDAKDYAVVNWDYSDSHKFMFFDEISMIE